MKYEKYFPLGTVLKLKDIDKRFMITGFMAKSKKDSSQLYDYTGCLYPEGFIMPDKMVLFNHRDIEKLYCIGFSDNEEKGFKEVLKDIEQSIEQ